jgi:hypothetical protein
MCHLATLFRTRIRPSNPKSFCSLIDGGSGLNSTDLFGATDCINGSILPKELFGTYQTNYTVLIDVHRKYGPQNKLDQVTMLRF